MAEDRNTIAQELTDEQLDQFIAELAVLPKKQRRLVDIQAKAKGLGLEISLMSARSFKEVTFARALSKMRTAQEVALQVEGIETGGNTLANASAKLLSKRIFNQLLEAEETGDDVDIDALSLSVSRLRIGDVRNKALELAQFKAAEEALKHAGELKTIAENKTLDHDQQVERVRLRLFGHAPIPPSK